MKKPLTLVVSIALVCIVVACAGRLGGKRNPFGVVDVPVAYPDNDEVRAFAAAAKLAGNDRDENAANWPPTATKGDANSLEGDWYSRWGVGAESTSVKAKGGRLYFLTYDSARQPTWLLEAKREGNNLLGRWVNVRNRSEHGLFAGVIVGNDRIDGVWTDGGARWDFRRRLQ